MQNARYVSNDTFRRLPMPRVVRRRSHRTAATALLLMWSTLSSGCVSYTVGQGAETVAPYEKERGVSANMVPITLNDGVTDHPTYRPSLDAEFRYGVDERTDVGVRVTSVSGVMLSWKRQLTAADTSSTPENRVRTAIMLAGGVLNFAEHASFEATLITSGAWSTYGQPYGAVRVMAVAPLNATARKDDPAGGIAFGFLFGDRQNSIGPELGVYYDRSTLGLNPHRIIVIPSLVVRRSGITGFGRRF